MPSKAGVCRKQNLNAESMAKTKETVPEVNQRGEKAKEQLNMKATLYKAPHARNATTSRANEVRNIRTYSRIPLHLRKDVPIRTQQNTRIENQNESHTRCRFKHVLDDRSIHPPDLCSWFTPL